MSEISSLEEQFKLQKEESIKIFKNIDSHEKELRNKRLEIIQQWVGTNTNIKMYLKVMGNLENAEETFRGIIRKSGREYAKDILERDDDNKPQKGLLYELMESSIPWEKEMILLRRFNR